MLPSTNLSSFQFLGRKFLYLFLKKKPACAQLNLVLKFKKCLSIFFDLLNALSNSPFQQDSLHYLILNPRKAYVLVVIRGRRNRNKQARRKIQQV